MSSAIRKPLKESKHAKATTTASNPRRDQLLRDITNYLKEIEEEEVKNSGGLQLLCAMGEYFAAQRACKKKQKQKKEELPVLAAIKTMENCLSRIENQNLKTTPPSYATTAAKGN
ncbi:hypothetical protein MMC22_001378 [Lobaria immixta]|nr:hypothetical protein [Lobaria immixta]